MNWIDWFVVAISIALETTEVATTKVTVECWTLT